MGTCMATASIVHPLPLQARSAGMGTPGTVSCTGWRLWPLILKETGHGSLAAMHGKRWQRPCHAWLVAGVERCLAVKGAMRAGVAVACVPARAWLAWWQRLQGCAHAWRILHFCILGWPQWVPMLPVAPLQRSHRSRCGHAGRSGNTAHCLGCLKLFKKFLLFLLGKWLCQICTQLRFSNWKHGDEGSVQAMRARKPL